MGTAVRRPRQPVALFPIPLPGRPAVSANDPQAHSQEEPATCIHRASFTLRLRFPESLAADVEAAAWSWVNFGGIGARTRRDCTGSPRCNESQPPAVARRVGEWFNRNSRTHLAAGEIDAAAGRCFQEARLLARLEAGEVIGVWSWLAGLQRPFRQGEGFARNEGGQPNRPGRSRYPEPETIRESMRANRGQSGHQRVPQIPADAFPRAELGMPIVFHFQGRGEPGDTILQPRGSERMASPIILKPLALADGRAVPILVALLAPGASDIELLAGKRSIRTWDARAIHDPRLSNYPNSPLAGLSSQGSALEAFLNFAQRPQPHDGPGFEEITP